MVWPFGDSALDWLIFLSGLVLLTHHLLRKRYRYFEERAMPQVPTRFLLGNTFDALRGKETMSECFQKIYDQSKGKRFCGFFQFTQPCLMLRDPALIRRVLVTDFTHFQDHGIRVDAKTNPLEGNLFNLTGKEWRGVRRRLGPAFSTGRLKWMSKGLEEAADEFVGALLAEMDLAGDVELKGITSRFTTDVVASSAFGLRGEALSDPNCPFNRMAGLVFKPSLMRTLRIIFRFSLPWLYFRLKIKTVPKQVNDFFLGLLTSAFKERKVKGGGRRDLAQLLLELKEKGEIPLEDYREKDEDGGLWMHADPYETMEMTDELLAAQAFGFYTGGVESTSSALSFALYELAKNPEAQEEVREEMVKRMLKGDDSNAYEFVNKLDFLDAVVSESLRLHPPAQFLMRECTKRASLVKGLEIEKGTPVLVPIHSVHSDPDNFPEPHRFLPRRFLDEAASSKAAFLAFGDGPRICIGRRFALFVIKLALVKILSKYRLSPSSKNPEELQYQTKGFLLSFPEGGLWVRLERI